MERQKIGVQFRKLIIYNKYYTSGIILREEVRCRSIYLFTGGQHSTGQLSRKKRTKSWSHLSLPRPSQNFFSLLTITKRQINLKESCNIYFRHERGFWEHDFGNSKEKIVYMQSHTLRAESDLASHLGSPFHFIKIITSKKEQWMPKITQLGRSQAMCYTASMKWKSWPLNLDDYWLLLLLCIYFSSTDL